MPKHPKPLRLTPGQLLRDELQARGWTQKALAEIMGRPVQLINEIIHDKKQITAETAWELGEALGIPAEHWWNLEKDYRLEKALSEVNLKQVSQRKLAFEEKLRTNLMRPKSSNVPKAPMHHHRRPTA